MEKNLGFGKKWSLEGTITNSPLTTFFILCRFERDHLARRFYMAYHNDCAGDGGWLVMVMKDEACNWGRNCGNKPCFLYSKKETAAIWSNADGK